MWTQIYGQSHAKIPFCGPQANGINIYLKYICTTQPSWVAQCDPALFLFQNLGSTASCFLFCLLRTWKYWPILHLYMEQITYKQAEAQWLIWGFSKWWGRTKAETCLTFTGSQLVAPQLVSLFVQHHLLNTATEKWHGLYREKSHCLPICTTRSFGNSLEGFGLIWLRWTFLTTVCTVYPLIHLLPITSKFLTRMKLFNSSNSKFFFWKENISSGITT